MAKRAGAVVPRCAALTIGAGRAITPAVDAGLAAILDPIAAGRRGLPFLLALLILSLFLALGIDVHKPQQTEGSAEGNLERCEEAGRDDAEEPTP
jgi:hypothetical protein